MLPSERAFTETIQIHGLNDFLKGVFLHVTNESATNSASRPSVPNTLCSTEDSDKDFDKLQQTSEALHRYHFYSVDQ